MWLGPILFLVNVNNISRIYMLGGNWDDVKHIAELKKLIFTD